MENRIKGIVDVTVSFKIGWKENETPEESVKIIAKFTEKMGKALINDKRLVSDISIEAKGNGARFNPRSL